MTIVGVLPRSFSYLQNSHYEIYTPKVLDASEHVLRDGSAGDFDERRSPPRGDRARVGDQIVRARERFARGEEPFTLWTPRRDRPTITSNDGHERAGLNATTVSRRSSDGERRLQGTTMTTADTELSDQFQNIRRDLDSSKQEFLDAMNGYDSVHDALEAKVAEHIRKYVTATPGRAPLIREKAREALNRIKEFSRTQTRLAESVALLRLKLDADLLAITTAEMQAAMNSETPRRNKGRILFSSKPLIQRSRRPSWHRFSGSSRRSHGMYIRRFRQCEIPSPRPAMKIRC